MDDFTSEETANRQPARKARPNALAAYETLGRFLENDKWFPQAVAEQHAYRTYYKGKHGELRVFAQVRVDLEQFIFYAISTVKIPEVARPAVAEFITRANYGLRVGNFELDYSDGEVRYKSSLDFEGETLTLNLIRNAIYPAVQTMDSYLPGLLKVAFGGLTPFEAIEEIEG
jgi:hypothetical protein